MICVHPGCTATNTRPYGIGQACPQHTPSKLAGRPEPDELVDTERDYVALRTSKGTPWVFSQADSRLVDLRAVSSGKRRSTAAAYRAARSELEQRKAQR